MDPSPNPPAGRWRLDPGGQRVDVDLEDVDVDVGADVIALVNALRAAARGGHQVVVHACPQLLAHTLYKAGILAAGAITLASVRDEEPYG